MRMGLLVVATVVVVASLAGSARADEVSARAPIGLWTFDDGTGADSSGAGHDGVVTAAAGASSIDGRLVLRFDGTGTRVTVPDRPDLHLRSSLTVAARVRPSRVDRSHTILGKWYARDAYMLLVEKGRYVFSVAFPGGKWGKAVNVQAPARAGQWADVAGSYDGRELRLYVDGRLAASKAVEGGLLQDSDRPLVIGNHPDWNAFEGFIDEVRLYDCAVPAESVGSLFPPRNLEAPEAAPAPPAGKRIGSWLGVN